MLLGWSLLTARRPVPASDKTVSDRCAGPAGLPLFTGPTARQMRRYGAVDDSRGRVDLCSRCAFPYRHRGALGVLDPTSITAKFDARMTMDGLDSSAELWPANDAGRLDDLLEGAVTRIRALVVADVERARRRNPGLSQDQLARLVVTRLSARTKP